MLRRETARTMAMEKPVKIEIIDKFMVNNRTIRTLKVRKEQLH